MKHFVFILLSTVSFTYGQVEFNKQYIIDLLENNSESTEDLSFLIDHFSELQLHPIDINNSTRQELISSKLFNSNQINELLAYRITYGSFIVLEELKNLNSIDHHFYIYIQPFLTLKSVPQSFNFNEGKAYILTRSEFQLNPPSGFESNAFIRSAFNQNTRFRYINTSYGTLGFSLDNDFGERISPSSKNPTGYDYSSYYLYYHPKGKKHKAALGNYTLQFGQGLHIWNGFGFSKSIYSTEIAKHDIELREFSSANESRNLKGIAFSYGGKLSIMPFFSHKKIDTNLEDSVFTSFQTSGLHRTENEIINKQNTTETLKGLRICYSDNNSKVGITSSHLNFSIPYQPRQQLYNKFQFTGSNLQNNSIDYHYYKHNIELFGEVAISNNKGIAQIHGLKHHFSSKVTSVIAYRNFNKQYFSRYTNALSESSSVNDEVAIYYGLNFSFHNKWHWSFYMDRYHFNWLKYHIDSPTKGIDYNNQITFKYSNTTTFSFRMKHETKGHKTPSIYSETAVIPESTKQFRFQLNHRISEHFKISTRIEFKNITQDTTTDSGWSMYQDLHYSTRKITLASRYGLFSTSSFDSGIYSYENDVRYSFTTVNYYGVGSRFYLLLKYHFNKHIDFYIKYANTTFSDRTTIGSGNNLINGNSKNTLKLQLIYKL